MPRRNFIILVLILLLIGGVVYGLRNIKQEPQSSTIFTDEQETVTPLNQETIDYIAANIGKLSPISPVLGGKWYVTRFSVIDENHLYVEYEDGHIVSRLLLEKKDDQWNVLAVFSPGKDMWKLTSGKDEYQGAHLTIYEMDQETEKWKLIN